MENLVFISSALQQPRHQKRIDLLRTKYNLKVIYFKRDKYTKNYKNYVDDAQCLGIVEDGKYFNRIFVYFNLIYVLLTSGIKKVYCTSPDQALIALILGKDVYLEVGDLYQVDGRNRVFKILDYFIIPFIRGLVLTSPFFYSGYFSKFKKYIGNKYVVVENKLPIYFLDNVLDYRRSFKPSSTKKNVGLIGSLAFKESLMAVRDFIANNKDFELHIFGGGLVDIFLDLSNVTYHGTFRNPDDLINIYQAIDINIILYDLSSNNVKFALPNKLYESIAFLKPIVCADGVALSSVVTKKGIGSVVKNASLYDAIYEVINSYGSYIQNLEKLDISEFIVFEENSILELMVS